MRGSRGKKDRDATDVGVVSVAEAARSVDSPGPLWRLREDGRDDPRALEELRLKASGVYSRLRVSHHRQICSLSMSTDHEGNIAG